MAFLAVPIVSHAPFRYVVYNRLFQNISGISIGVVQFGLYDHLLTGSREQSAAVVPMNIVGR